jgi:hypothetical protein
MTRDEIMDLAKEVGLTVDNSLEKRYALLNETTFWEFNKMLEEFATKAYAAGAAAEREACAKVCEDYDDDGGAGEAWAGRFAAAIRARSEP